MAATRESERGRFGRAVVGLVAAVAAVAVAAACGQSGPVATPSIAGSPGGGSTPSAAGSVTVRWFIGVGAGTQPAEVEAEKAFVASYNAVAGGTKIALEVVPNANALDVLRTEIGAGNPPDIVGPIGTAAAGQLPGLFLDLNAEIKAQKFDVGAYEPALLKYLQQGGAQLGLPYVVYPGYIFYSKQIFAKANLPDLPKKVGGTYLGQTWDWDMLGRVAAQLTLDSDGRTASQKGFNSTKTIQYGLGFPWTDARRLASTFGGGSFLATDGKTAQIPAVWRDAFNWYYSGVWKGYFIPTGTVATACPLEGCPKPDDPSTGHVAMAVSWPWAISTYVLNGQARFSGWDMAVMPSWKGVTSSPLDVDSLQIAKASKHPDEAFRVMTALLADATLRTALGGVYGMPARTGDQAAWFDSMDTAQAGAFPGNKVSWSVLQEMARHPTTPSHEAALPNKTQSLADIDAFLLSLRSKSGLDVNAELEKLRDKLQADFDAVQPLA